MFNMTRDNKILMTMSHTREIGIDEVLQINLQLPKSIGNIQIVKVLFNRQNESPCIIKELKTKEEENDFITYQTLVSFAPFHRFENYFFFFSDFS